MGYWQRAEQSLGSFCLILNMLTIETLGDKVHDVLSQAKPLKIFHQAGCRFHSSHVTVGGGCMVL